MRLIFLLTSLFISAQFLAAQAYTELLAEAKTEYDNGKYRRAGKLYEEAFTLRSPRTDELHLAVSAWAQADKKDQAFERLNFGIRSGWITLDRLLADPTLHNLYEDERWDQASQLLATYTYGSNPELRDELATITKRDQYYRMQMQEIAQEHGWQSAAIQELYDLQAGIDLMNIQKIDSIIVKYGYPGRSMVGGQSSTALFVIQRADLETQLRYLDLLTATANKDELLWSDLALMIDRIQMAKEAPQIYGTQVIRSTNGLPEFYPIEDIENINERRRKAGLMPIEEYAAKFGL